MIRRPPRSTRTDTLFPTRRSSDLEIEDMAEDFAADLSGSVASMVFTALIHPGKIEARADATERLVERRIEPKAAALEARAKPLCASFAKLAALEPVIGINVIDAQADDAIAAPQRGLSSDRKS